MIRFCYQNLGQPIIISKLLTTFSVGSNYSFEGMTWKLSSFSMLCKCLAININLRPDTYVQSGRYKYITFCGYTSADVSKFLILLSKLYYKMAKPRRKDIYLNILSYKRYSDLLIELHYNFIFHQWPYTLHTTIQFFYFQIIWICSFL